MYIQTAPALMRPDLDSYDRILVAYSGGKDCTACLLHLLELGVPKGRIELHHHDVDGGWAFMDWPVTPDYCRAIAQALDIPIFFSWKEGGFLGEMQRDGTPTAPIRFEYPDSDGEVLVRSVGGQGPAGTRGRFPQVSADLSVRWCSSYLKIDVFAAMVRNQDRFLNVRTLVITGERADESTARSRYAQFEPHRADTRNSTRRMRHIDHWRPVHTWAESEVWSIMSRHGIVPHVAYQMGWGRLSCMTCIFGSKNQWASVDVVAPRRLNRIATSEQASGKTIHRTQSVRKRAADGSPYAAINEELVDIAMGYKPLPPVLIDPALWQLPAGAYGESTGPT